MKRLTQDEFIKKAKKIHGDKYDYSKTKFINLRNDICIICPEHGEFWQRANDHIHGHGCPECGGTKKINSEEFIKRARYIHGDKYDYSKTKYINANTKVCIICPEHGEFWQNPFAHLNGHGCPKCCGMHKTNEDIIKEFREVHGDKYDYSKIDYVKNDQDITIICPIHGEFKQKPYKHLIGHGCPKCGIESRVKKQFLNTVDVIEKFTAVHGDKYDYSKVEYKSMRDKVCIICPKHGEFWQYPFDHVNGHGCPKCGYQLSISENEIYEYCCKLVGKENVIQRDRDILDGKEIDIFIPSIGIGIEYNGLKWHSEEYGKDYRYHIRKLEEAQEKGVKLIQIFEDEYLNHKEVVLNKIAHLLKSQDNLPKIMGRKCVIKEIAKEDSEIFLNKFHIQGYGKCTVSLGAYYQGFLVGAMSFLNENNGNWNLVRFASDYNYVCQGVGGKLFKYFIKNYNPTKIKTFADRRWTLNREKNLYTELGFTEDALLKPDYRYVNPQSPFDRIHKFSFRKRCLHRKYSLPMKMTEGEMVKELGFFKIWDCGLIRYVWKK